MATRRISLLLAALAAFACDAVDPPAAPEAEHGAALDEGSGLPAWETPAERATPGKADEHDDYRAAHPELYGVTAPPSEPVLSFAEYAPAQSMMMRPGGSIGAFHEGILLGAAGHVPQIVILHEPGQADALAAAVKGLGLDLDDVQLLDVVDTDAIWTRDYGPISHLTDRGEVGFTDFRYYHGRHWDDAIPTRLAADWGVNVFRPSLSFEGGNLMADQQGTCYATEKIHQQNPGHTKAEIDTWMREYAGCRQLVTLIRPKGLGTGHIDMFAKLMDETTMIFGEYDPEQQPQNAAILDDNVALLEAVTTVGGAGLSIFRLPLPWDETGVWYTYTNALILNDTVLVPVYSKFKDLEAQALEVYQTAAPHLSVWAVNSDNIIPSGGAIHCVTMTVPEGKLTAYQEPPVQLCADNELESCGDVGPCGGLPWEGECDGARLLYCGSNGYPQAASCADCCGWDPAGNGGGGWYACRSAYACAACADPCEPEEPVTGTAAWICDEAICGEDCAAVCDPIGSRTCSPDGLMVQVCAADETGCPVLDDAVPCPLDTVCVHGACVAPGESGGEDALSEPDVSTEVPEEGRGNGCTAAPHGAAVPYGFLLLALLLVSFGARPRARAHAHSQSQP